MCVCTGKEEGRSVEISYVTDSRDAEEYEVIGGADNEAVGVRGKENLTQSSCDT